MALLMTTRRCPLSALLLIFLLQLNTIIIIISAKQSNENPPTSSSSSSSKIEPLLSSLQLTTQEKDVLLEATRKAKQIKDDGGSREDVLNLWLQDGIIDVWKKVFQDEEDGGLVIEEMLSRVDGNGDGELTSIEIQLLQHTAMYATIIDNSASPIFTSSNNNADELRAYYYFHSGISMAGMNTMEMSPSKSLDDDDDDDIDDINYLLYVERMLEYELKRVHKQLKGMDFASLNEKKKQQRPSSLLSSSSTEEDNNSSKSPPSSQTESNEEEDYEEDVNTLPPEERLNKQYGNQYNLYQCQKYHGIFSSEEEVQQKWTELYHRYIKFISELQDHHHNHHHHDNNVDVDSNTDLYLNFTMYDGKHHNQDGNSTTTNESTITTTTIFKPRVYASRNFTKGEIIIVNNLSSSQQQNHILYFTSINIWRGFLESLPNNRDVCIAIQLSVVKQISRPGRFIIGLVLNESIFIRKLIKDVDVGGEKEKKAMRGNVALDDYARSFDYVALNNIIEGTEIVDDGQDA